MGKLVLLRAFQAKTFDGAFRGDGYEVIDILETDDATLIPENQFARDMRMGRPDDSPLDVLVDFFRGRKKEAEKKKVVKRG